MTPQEKAKELVSKFRKYANGTDDEDDRFSPAIERENARQCALIALDEILNNQYYAPSEYYKYWREVKIEIEKL